MTRVMADPPSAAEPLPLPCALTEPLPEGALSALPLIEKPLEPFPFVAFDLEMTPAAWPGGSVQRVLCAGTARVSAAGAMETKVWQGAGPWMYAADLCKLIDFLWAEHEAGVTVVTWSGLASDWRVMAAEVRAASPAHADKCAVMARHHVDVAFAAASSLGGMMSLSAACAGMGLPAKHPYASASIPAMWAFGYRDMVLRHVEADAVATAAVYAAMFSKTCDGADPHTPTLTWETKKGAMTQWYAPYTTRDGRRRLLTVHECLSRPRPRPKFPVPSHLELDAMAGWLPPTADTTGKAGGASSAAAESTARA